MNKRKKRAHLMGLLTMIFVSLGLNAACAKPSDESALGDEESSSNAATETPEETQAWKTPMSFEDFVCRGYDHDPVVDTIDNTDRGIACGFVGKALAPMIDMLLDDGSTRDTFELYPFVADESVECNGELLTNNGHFVVTWCSSEGYMAIDVVQLTSAVTDDKSIVVEGSTLWALSIRTLAMQSESSMINGNIACMAGVLSRSMDASAIEAAEMQESLFATDAALGHFGDEADELSALFADGANGEGCFVG